MPVLEGYLQNRTLLSRIEGTLQLMSLFAPGTNGTLKSTTQPAALFELARALDAAENRRNGDNPGLAPKRNTATTVSFDTGTIAIAVAIPMSPSLDAAGVIQLTPSDYLGAPYSDFLNGGGELYSTNLIAAFAEMSQTLAAHEKAITPVDDQPNNIQVEADFETGLLTISANLPFTSSVSTGGDVVIHAVDYL